MDLRPSARLVSEDAERYHLTATLLLGHAGGSRDARMIRRRRGRRAAPSARAVEGALTLPRARLGAAPGAYDLEPVIPPALHNPDIQASLAATKATVVAQHDRFKEPFVEVALDVTRDDP
jgi:hypothetical protein